MVTVICSGCKNALRINIDRYVGLPTPGVVASKLNMLYLGYCPSCGRRFGEPRLVDVELVADGGGGEDARLSTLVLTLPESLLKGSDGNISKLIRKLISELVKLSDEIKIDVAGDRSFYDGVKRKVAVKIPASVRRKLEEVAEKNNASVNDIIVAGLKYLKLNK